MAQHGAGADSRRPFCLRRPGEILRALASSALCAQRLRLSSAFGDYARMKQLRFLVLGATLLAGCSKPTAPTETRVPEAVSAPTPANYPVLLIDEPHQIQGTNTPAPYQISSTPGIRLDATQFHFTYGTDPITPNMVQFVGGGSVYRLSRRTETNTYVIDGTTLEAVRGATFRGFRPGDHMMFAIGRSTNSSPGKEDFWVSWAGQIEVK